MTRETKIGLLVGLAFIIVIGILLSEYNRTEPQPLPMATAADSLRAGAATPHNDSNDTEVVPPPAPAPTRAVPTRDELRSELHVQVYPGAAARSTPPTLSAPSVIKPDSTAPAGPGNNLPNPQIPETVAVQPTVTPEPGMPTPPVAQMPPVKAQVLPLTPANPPAAAPAGPRQYTVVPGDTLSKLAGRFLGKNNQANRDAIVALNPSLKQNPNNLTVGRTYTIPPMKAVAKALPAPSPAPAKAVAAAPAPAKPTDLIPSGPQYWYTVKEDDSLWRIAKTQLGDGQAVAAIKELNKDVLKGGDTIHPNMRLRLPAKPVASTD